MRIKRLLLSPVSLLPSLWSVYTFQYSVVSFQHSLHPQGLVASKRRISYLLCKPTRIPWNLGFSRRQVVLVWVNCLSKVSLGIRIRQRCSVLSFEGIDVLFADKKLFLGALDVWDRLFCLSSLRHASEWSQSLLHARHAFYFRDYLSPRTFFLIRTRGLVGAENDISNTDTMNNN